MKVENGGAGCAGGGMDSNGEIKLPPSQSTCIQPMTSLSLLTASTPS
jgi:hypothetical protein